MPEVLKTLLAELDVLLHPSPVEHTTALQPPWVAYFTFFTSDERRLWWDVYHATPTADLLGRLTNRTWHIETPEQWAKEQRDAHPDWFVLPYVAVDHAAVDSKMAAVLGEIAAQLVQIDNALVRLQMKKQGGGHA